MLIKMNTSKLLFSDTEESNKIIEALFMPKYVYKYRHANINNLKALINNQLYVPRTDYLNDVSELALYSSEQSCNAFERFLTLLQKGCYVLSFGSEKDNVLLWNTYSDSFSGFVIEYSFSDIKEQIGIQGRGSRCGFINYNDNKILLPEKIISFYKEHLNDNIILKDNCPDYMFTKSSFWCKEKEFRFIFGVEEADKDYINKNGALIYKKGFFIENIKPSKVIIGYRQYRPSVAT